jgi:hypothetical protein
MSLRLVSIAAARRGLFPQNHRRGEFRGYAGHGLMHRIRAKVNAPRPFHAAKVGIDGDGVENAGVEKFKKHAAAPFGFNGKNPFQAVVKTNLQTIPGQWPRC